MKTENSIALEKLSIFCHFCGLFSTFIGIVVGLMELLNSDFRHMQTGLYIFATGYALYKIGARIAKVVASEKGQ